MKKNKKTNSQKKVRVDSTRQKIYNAIDLHEEFKNAYFWYGNNRDPRLTWDESFNFKFDNNRYEVIQRCHSSRKNVYYTLQVYVNDVKKDVRALKKIV